MSFFCWASPGMPICPATCQPSISSCNLKAWRSPTEQGWNPQHFHRNMWGYISLINHDLMVINMGISMVNGDFFRELMVITMIFGKWWFKHVSQRFRSLAGSFRCTGFLEHGDLNFGNRLKLRFTGSGRPKGSLDLFQTTGHLVLLVGLTQ